MPSKCLLPLVDRPRLLFQSRRCFRSTRALRWTPMTIGRFSCCCCPVGAAAKRRAPRSRRWRPPPLAARLGRLDDESEPPLRLRPNRSTRRGARTRPQFSRRSLTAPRVASTVRSTAGEILHAESRMKTPWGGRARTCLFTASLLISYLYLFNYASRCFRERVKFLQYQWGCRATSQYHDVIILTAFWQLPSSAELTGRVRELVPAAMVVATRPQTDDGNKVITRNRPVVGWRRGWQPETLATRRSNADTRGERRDWRDDEQSDGVGRTPKLLVASNVNDSLAVRLGEGKRLPRARQYPRRWRPRHA